MTLGPAPLRHANSNPHDASGLVLIPRSPACACLADADDAPNVAVYSHALLAVTGDLRAPMASRHEGALQQMGGFFPLPWGSPQMRCG